MSDFGKRRDIQHFQAGIAQHFTKHQFGIRLNRAGEGIHVPRIYKGRRNTETRQRVFQQIVRAAIHRARRHNMITGAQNRRDRQMQSRLTAGRHHRTHAMI